MKRILLFTTISLLLLTSCEKESFAPLQKTVEHPLDPLGKMDSAFLYNQFIRPNLKGATLLQDTLQRCPGLIVNVDSLFTLGYFVWFENFPDGSFNEYSDGDLPRVRASNVKMRCDIYGHGGGKFWLEGDSLNKRHFGISHYPSATIGGMDLYEIYNKNRHFVIRKNIASGQWLTFCSAIHGYHNVGTQTGRLQVYFKNANDEYFVANQLNSIGFSLTVYDGSGPHVVDETNFTEYGSFMWRNFQSDQIDPLYHDYFQEWAVTHFLVVITLNVQGQDVHYNVYAFQMRSDYLSINGDGNSYEYQAGDPDLGEFLFLQ